MIRKEDVNQSRIRVGHLGVKRDIPDQYALLVMNDILGGGGFTSRILRRVRSDEGLAYSAGSEFDRPVLYPGTFQAFFQTKHATAAFGTRLIVDEIERIRKEKCAADAVENAKASLIGNVVNPFSSRHNIVNTFADDDYTGRPDEYWQEYTKNVEAVTPGGVLEAAKKYLHPDKLVFLVVGDPKAVEEGSDKHPERYSDFGPVTILPLRDPMTLEAK
jgi:zinc protease